MSANALGIEATTKLLKASGDIAVIVYRAQKSARKADGSIDTAALGSALAAQLMANPAAIDEIKAAASSVNQVPSEIKDLTFTEGLQLIGAAGGIAAKCAAEINA